MASGTGTHPARRRFFPARFGLDDAEEVEPHAPSLKHDAVFDRRPSSWAVPEEKIGGHGPFASNACHDARPQEHFSQAQACEVGPTLSTSRDSPPRPAQAVLGEPSPDMTLQEASEPSSHWVDPSCARLVEQVPAGTCQLADVDLWRVLDERELPGLAQQGFGASLDSGLLEGARNPLACRETPGVSSLQADPLQKPGGLSLGEGDESAERLALREAPRSAGVPAGTPGAGGMDGMGGGGKRRAVLPASQEKGSLPSVCQEVPANLWGMKLEREELGPASGVDVLRESPRGLEADTSLLQLKDESLAAASWNDVAYPETLFGSSEDDTWLETMWREGAETTIRTTMALCQIASAEGQSGEADVSMTPASGGATVKSTEDLQVPELSGPSSVRPCSADVSPREALCLASSPQPDTTALSAPPSYQKGFPSVQGDASCTAPLASSQRTADAILQLFGRTSGQATAGVPASARPEQAGQPASLTPALDAEVEDVLSSMLPRSHPVGPGQCSDTLDTWHSMLPRSHPAGSGRYKAEEPPGRMGAAEAVPIAALLTPEEQQRYPAPSGANPPRLLNGIHAPDSRLAHGRKRAGAPQVFPSGSLSARLAQAIEDLHGRGDALGQSSGYRADPGKALARYRDREGGQGGVAALAEQAGASLASSQGGGEERSLVVKSEPGIDAACDDAVLSPSGRTAGGAGDGRMAADAGRVQEGSISGDAILGKRKANSSSGNVSGGSSSSSNTGGRAGALQLVPQHRQSPRGAADVALQHGGMEHWGAQSILESFSGTRPSGVAVKMIMHRAPTPAGHEMAGAVNAMKQRLVAAALSVEQGNVRQFQQAYSYLKTFAKPRGNALERLVFGSLQAFMHKVEGTAFAFLTTPCKKPIKDMIDARMWYFRTIPYGAFMSVCILESMIPKLIGHKFVHVVDFGDTMVPHWPKLMQVLRQARQAGDRLEGIKITHVMTMPLGHPGRLDMTATSMAPPFAAVLQNAAHELGIEFEFQSLHIDLEHLSLLNCIQRQPLEQMAFCVAYDLKFFSQDPAVGGGALQRLMSTLRRLKPEVAVLVEDEADSTELPLVHRFGKMYDYMWALYHAHDMLAPGKRKKSVHLCEQQYFNLNLCSVVACQGEERRIQLRSWKDWKRIFELYGFATQPISASLRRATENILDQFTEGFGISEGDGGLCLTWQGAPLLSTCSWTWGGEE